VEKERKGSKSLDLKRRSKRVLIRGLRTVGILMRGRGSWHHGNWGEGRTDRLSGKSIPGGNASSSGKRRGVGDECQRDLQSKRVFENKGKKGETIREAATTPTSASGFVGRTRGGWVREGGRGSPTTWYR